MVDKHLVEYDRSAQVDVPILAKDIGGAANYAISVDPGNIDRTNGIAKTLPKAAWGSGGRVTASGVLHNAPCIILGFNIQCTTAGTIDIADSAAGGGTSLATLTGEANKSRFEPWVGPPIGVAVYGTFTTFVGSITAVVGPAVQ